VGGDLPQQRAAPLRTSRIRESIRGDNAVESLWLRVNSVRRRPLGAAIPATSRQRAPARRPSAIGPVRPARTRSSRRRIANDVHAVSKPAPSRSRSTASTSAFTETGVSANSGAPTWPARLTASREWSHRPWRCSRRTAGADPRLLGHAADVGTGAGGTRALPRRGPPRQCSTHDPLGRTSCASGGFKTAPRARLQERIARRVCYRCRVPASAGGSIAKIAGPLADDLSGAAPS
jgi:hypothetical protein